MVGRDFNLDSRFCPLFHQLLQFVSGIDNSIYIAILERSKIQRFIFYRTQMAMYIELLMSLTLVSVTVGKVGT